MPYWWNWRSAHNSGKYLANIPSEDRAPRSLLELNLQEIRRRGGSARDAVQTIPNKSKTAYSPEYNIQNIIEKDVLN